MKRREFTKLTGLGIIAISTTGFIRFDGMSYVGDCETTSDILGPFYRPDSPVRSNLVIEDLPGEIVELSGVVRHKDCVTAYENAKVELWHCSSSEVYDNDSSEFRYRGTTYTGADGKYNFTTQLPVPYDAGGGNYRPAHFHMMISAPGYQTLITQIYFQDDPHLKNDPSSANPKASKRILKLNRKDGKVNIVFNCNMNDKLKATDVALQKLSGKYKEQNTGVVTEFFERDGDLWVKNDVFGKIFRYTGMNQFEYDGLPEGMYERLHFDLKEDGKFILTKKTSYGNGKEKIRTFKQI